MVPRPSFEFRLAALLAGLLSFAAPFPGVAKENPADAVEKLAQSAVPMVDKAEKSYDDAVAAEKELRSLFFQKLGTSKLPKEFGDLKRDSENAVASGQDGNRDELKKKFETLRNQVEEVRKRFDELQGEWNAANESFRRSYEDFTQCRLKAVGEQSRAGEGSRAAERYQALFEPHAVDLLEKEKSLRNDFGPKVIKLVADCNSALRGLEVGDRAIATILFPPPPARGSNPAPPRLRTVVKFESNGEVFETREVEPGSYVERPKNAVPEKKWHNLVGWKIDGKGELVDPATTKAPADASAINFSAVWTPVKFPVRFADSPDPESELALDDPLPAVTPPEKEHYRFLGWSADENAGKPDALLAEGTLLKTVFDPEHFSRLDLHPVWAPVSYPVRFLSRTGTSRDPVEVAAAEGSVESPVARPSDPDPVPGCVFEGWAASGSDGFYDFGAPVEAPLDLVARWTPVAHKVSFLDFDGNPFAEAEGSVDAPVSAPAETPFRVGSAFAHWTADEAGHPWDGFGKPLLEDATLRPVGRDKVFEVSFRAGNGVEPDPEPQRVVYGGTALRPPDPEPPRAGIVFAGWTRAGKPGRAPYDFSAPVTEPLVLAGLWAFPASVRVVPGGFDASATVGGFAGRVSRVSDWCAGRGFTADWAWALSGLLGVVLLVELVALFRRR